MPAALPEAVELGALAIAATLGAMLFFWTCAAPMATMRLEADVAARYLRAMTRGYHAFGVAGSTAGAFLCAGAAPAAAALSLAAALAFLLVRQALLPAIDAARDAAMADAGAAHRLQRLRRTSLAAAILQVALLLPAFPLALARG
ncbi:MAG: hypothetical protein ACK515_17035 [bacterium]|jgi:hypothetical protein|nr:hypothetical protein [Betaproteobacteria bacterium]